MDLQERAAKMPMRHLDSNARAIVDLADDIAHEYELDYVGTEHILLAILRHNQGLGARVLRELGVAEENARRAVDHLVQRSKEDTWVFGRLPGSPHYRKVIESAIEEANQLEAKLIGSEHLLLALLRETGTIAQKALAMLGVTPEKCRDAIMRDLQDLEQAN
jgi:ATP-dependent Clp protease ATP-binding subunit ClpC